MIISLIWYLKINQKLNSKASPDGSTSDLAFAFWYGSENKYALKVGDSELYWKTEFITDKWYKVSLPEFHYFSKFENLFQIHIKQSKGQNNSCTAEGRWENELVTEHSFSCKTSGLKLYIAGTYGGNVLNGQVRNFSYAKN